SDIGDIVTVVIDIDENAQLDNSTTRTRNNSENVDVDSLLGYENALNSVLPEAVNPAALLAFDGQTNNSGGGAIDRQEAISVSVAAVVTQVLPNGNLVIQGRQETRVNYELRELQIAGVIRPQDISTANTVSYEKIAEARLAYGGRGQVSDCQQPRWGTQIMDVIMPF
ncbi:MAG TPA: flagellar basal body L-ring protein, partial [Rhodospirillaceae bacterium]|nr:flagellar basal body L-ring protein [Rhodospirillaceae bacterium]